MRSNLPKLIVLYEKLEIVLFNTVHIDHCLWFLLLRAATATNRQLVELRVRDAEQKSAGQAEKGQEAKLNRRLCPRALIVFSSSALAGLLGCEPQPTPRLL